MSEMTLEPSVSGRFKVTDRPEALPGTCVVCGSSGGMDDTRKFIDFGMQIDYYGAVIFCTHCFVEAANSIGLISDQQGLTLLERISILQVRLNELEAENATLRDFVRTFGATIEPILNSVSSSNKTEPILDETDTGEGLTDIPTPQPNIEQRSDDISNDGSSDGAFNFSL